MSDVNPCVSEDIWTEILKKLPVKTLGKCRCVCKSRHSLIISPSFMSAHHKYYTENDANSLLLFREIGQSRIMLWNPMFRKYINLPMSSTVSGSTDIGNSTSVLDFGYDCKKNDHSVVKITYSNAVKKTLIEVYSVQQRTWKTISSEFLVDHSINCVSFSNCFFNGVIHWLTLNSRLNSILKKWLFLFNVAEETFDKLELPEDIGSLSTSGNDFGVFDYGNKLAVSCCNLSWHGLISGRCRIWVKKEDDAGNCWCRILDVVLYGCLHIGSVQYLTRTGELLGFAKESDYMLTLFDPVTRRSTNLGLRQHVSTKFCNYTDSLVLLDQETEVYTEEELQRLIDDRRRRRIDFASLLRDLSEEDCLALE
ncbi:hypothetical protein RND81_05G147200 [Saponaria officinalis]|uniref:F-box domain-containing protein n=1 Tax=Saponaria officinalis TaxID=3572 RepID=A0AAW1KYH8_SAPOF